MLSFLEICSAIFLSGSSRLFNECKDQLFDCDDISIASRMRESNPPESAKDNFLSLLSPHKVKSLRVDFKSLSLCEGTKSGCQGLFITSTDKGVRLIIAFPPWLILSTFFKILLSES